MIAKERDTEYYIDKARELAALVAENTDRINEQRKIPTDVSNEIADAGVLPPADAAQSWGRAARPS